MRINSLIFFLFATAVVVSCGADSDEKVINAKDVIPSSNYKESTSNKVLIPIQDFGFSKDTAARYGLEYDSIYQNENKFFPERFSPKSSNKLVLKNESDSTLWYHWTFIDSIKTNNALYNWLDCFDEDCKAIKMYERKKLQQDNFFILVSDTSITYISSTAKLSKLDWLKYYKQHHGISNWKLVLHQKTKSKVEWTMIKGEDEFILTKE